MKNLKKILGIVMVLTMMFAMAVPAFAATDVTINVQTPEGASDAGETYTAYKIFDVTIDKETADQTGTAPSGTVSSFENISYYIDANSPFFSTIQSFKDEGKTVFDLNPVPGTTPVRYNVTLAEGVETYSAANLATELKKVITESTPKAYNGKSPVKVDNKGYYMILSTLGSAAIIDTVGQSNMTITTKNDLPTLNKTITDITNGNAADGKNGTAAYGSVVTFKLAVAIPGSAVGPIKVHDTMDAAFTYGDLTADTTEGITKSTTNDTGCTMDFEIPAAVVAANLGGEVNIVYTATVNKDVDTATALNNTAKLTYSEYTSVPSTVTVQTFEFDLVKTNSDKVLLPGAVFRLYSEAEGGDPITFTAAGNVYSVDAAGSADITVTNGKVTVKGLANGTYYLEETVAPEGYNQLKARQAFTINNANNAATVDVGEETTTWVSGGVQVINLTGAELPSTGGIGTTIFYIVGGLLIVVAGITLTVRRRVNNQE